VSRTDVCHAVTILATTTRRT